MKKVLIIDDMPTMIEQAQKVANGYYEISSCQSGADAQARIKAEKPDAVLLDMFLDDAESYDILRKIKADSEISGIPVIMTSADVSVLAMAKGYSLGAADFMKKPFVEEVMFRKIDAQIRLAETGWQFSGPAK